LWVSKKRMMEGSRGPCGGGKKKHSLYRARGCTVGREGGRGWGDRGRVEKEKKKRGPAKLTFRRKEEGKKRKLRLKPPTGAKCASKKRLEPGKREGFKGKREKQ